MQRQPAQAMSFGGGDDDQGQARQQQQMMQQLQMQRQPHAHAPQHHHSQLSPRARPQGQGPGHFAPDLGASASPQSHTYSPGDAPPQGASSAATVTGRAQQLLMARQQRQGASQHLTPGATLPPSSPSSSQPYHALYGHADPGVSQGFDSGASMQEAQVSPPGPAQGVASPAARAGVSTGARSKKQPHSDPTPLAGAGGVYGLSGADLASHAPSKARASSTARASSKPASAGKQAKKSTASSKQKASADKGAAPRKRGRPKGSGRKAAAAAATAAASASGGSGAKKSASPSRARGGRGAKTRRPKKTSGRKKTAAAASTSASASGGSAKKGPSMSELLQQGPYGASISDSVFSPPRTPGTAPGSVYQPNSSKRAKMQSGSRTYGHTTASGSPASPSTPQTSTPARSRKGTHSGASGGSTSGKAQASALSSSASATVAAAYVYGEEIEQLLHFHAALDRVQEDANALVEDIARQHVILVAQECSNAAALRGSDKLEFADITFALRRDPVRLARLTQFVRLRSLSSKDVRKMHNTVSRAWQCGSWDLLNSLNDMTPQHTVHYAKGISDDIKAAGTPLEMSDKAHKLARRASFTFKKTKKFRKWVQFQHFVTRKPTDDMLEWFGFVASETVAELAKSIRVVLRSDPKRRRNRRYQVTTDVVAEAFRRLQRDASFGSLFTMPLRFQRPHLMLVS